MLIFILILFATLFFRKTKKEDKVKIKTKEDIENEIKHLQCLLDVKIFELNSEIEVLESKFKEDEEILKIEYQNCTSKISDIELKVKSSNIYHHMISDIFDLLESKKKWIRIKKNCFEKETEEKIDRLLEVFDNISKKEVISK